MKTIITISNKKRFFGQYMLQEVLNYKNPSVHNIVDENVLDESRNNLVHSYLELKPLSSITDEDIMAIGFSFPHGDMSGLELKFYPDSYSGHWVAHKDGVSREGYLKVSDFDYLRSKGYAIPWMGLSVDDLINAGWVKLK